MLQYLHVKLFTCKWSKRIVQKVNKPQKALLEWYENYGRNDLPWRKTDDIYHIYISEIMLQQTQVSRVKKYFYPQFLEKFPSLRALGKAKVEEVLSLWSGLGYYSRARNLHKCAKLCKETGLPDDMKSLQKLPGIGRYTASAICSFGYGQAEAVVDTNIARVLKRYFALLHVKDEAVWEIAWKFLNTKSPKKHNLALMDLGSLVCTAKNPKCLLCPLMLTCKGKEEPLLYTVSKKSIYEKKELHLGICIKNNKIALYKSTDNLYKGLLVLPETKKQNNALHTFKHSYTKYRIEVFLYQVDEVSDKAIWLDIDKVKNAPISSLTKKALLGLDELSCDFDSQA